MLQRIGIAQALIHRPKLVILDEPKSGLDPDGRVEVSAIIRETSKEGTAVFFSSHLLPDAEKLCDRLIIMKKGRVDFEGSTQSLLEKASRGWVITYTKSLAENRSEMVTNLSELQKKIDQIRSQGSQIIEVKKESTGLEEAFRKLLT